MHIQIFQHDGGEEVISWKLVRKEQGILYVHPTLSGSHGMEFEENNCFYALLRLMETSANHNCTLS